MEDNLPIKNEVPQVSWNLSSFIIEDIAQHLSKSSNYFGLGLIDKSYWEMVIVEMRIGTYLSVEEKEELKKLSIILGKKQMKVRTPEEQSTYTFFFRKYNDLIMDYLKKYGFLIKPSEDSKRMF